METAYRERDPRVPFLRDYRNDLNPPGGTIQRQSVTSDVGVGAVIADSNGTTGSAGTIIGGGTLGTFPPSTGFLTVFTVGLACATGLGPAPYKWANYYSTGRISANYGVPVPVTPPGPPTPGPAILPKAQPVRAVIPQIAPRGRIYSHPGAPVVNPASGPKFRQATQPARIRVTQPPRGRIAANWALLLS